MPREEYSAVLTNGIEIIYDTFGNPHDPAVLLIMGLGAQMIDWREEFCELVTKHGYWVIRYDNRDIGKSQKFEEAGIPNILELAAKIKQGVTVHVPYSLKDLAADSVCLLDHLKIEKAHVVGLSLGGMIAQSVAIYYPERVLSLTSIMSSARYVLPATAEAAELLSKRSPDTKEEYIEYFLENSKILNGPKFRPDELLYREHASRKFDRGIYTPGFARQLAAVVTQEDRREKLQTINIPTLVMHGKSDPLIPVAAAVETADAIPNAKIHLIEGWGHGLPPSIWPTVIEDLIAHFGSV